MFAPPVSRFTVNKKTSKSPAPTPNLPSCFATGHQRRGLSFCPLQPTAKAMTRFIFFPSSPRTILGTSNGDDEVYLFPLRALLRARAPVSPPATCDCRPADNMLLATMSARQRISESRGAPAVPNHFGRVGSRRTNSHRFSSPAFPLYGYMYVNRNNTEQFQKVLNSNNSSLGEQLNNVKRLC